MTSDQLAVIQESGPVVKRRTRIIQNSETGNQKSELRAGSGQPRMDTDEHGSYPGSNSSDFRIQKPETRIQKRDGHR